MHGQSVISPHHRAIRRYYASLQAFRDQNVESELNLRPAFEFLLTDTAKLHGWTLVPELSQKTAGSLVRPDGTLRDANSLPRGYWEAKDTHDDLDAEIQRKIARGYKLSNIIFEDTQTGVLFQNKQEVLRAHLGDPHELAKLLNQFFAYTEPDIEGFEEAVEEFKERVPELAAGLAQKIREAHQSNARFIQAFAGFFKLCQTALNPNIRVEAVDEMLVQHLLTERLFRTIFDNPEFTKRNAIAQEVERVIDALLSQSFNRADYLKGLDRFYVAIESAARMLPDFSEKQHFLNSIYERFFQGYSVKVADTMGIVYTPQEIVNFMCASVAEVLETEFGTSLSSPDVFIIDPCTGTGNFIVNLLRRIPKRDLPRMYREQFFANEVMLMPYYIAALNIEHAYYELTGTYEAFEGLCFVDTLDLAEGSQHQLGFMTERNAKRVERQKRTPITVVIGNPPYNMGQVNENDNNKNRKYEIVDGRIRGTYAADSKATLKNKLYDPYVKFLRWATDRLHKRDGIVCFVTNNSFIDQQAFDGMQKHLLRDFTDLYHVDLHGNVRRNPKLSGTIHNVFGIQVGVGITVAVRRKAGGKHQLHYSRVPENWRKEEKLDWLAKRRDIRGVDWHAFPSHTWIRLGNADEYEAFLPLGTKLAKSSKAKGLSAIFKSYSLGVATNRDEWVYDFSREGLSQKIKKFVKNYNYEVFRLSQEATPPTDLDGFVNNNPAFLKWTDRLKHHLKTGQTLKFVEQCIRTAFYRPFTRKFLYFDPLLNHRQYMQRSFFPTAATEAENNAICCTNHIQIPFSCQMTNCVPDQAPGGRGGQSLPFYIYDEDGTNRHENITDWALGHFRKHYGDEKITKWDIFYYVYAVLHHPEYRAKYAENLKRELPRIPLVGAVILRSEATKNLGSAESQKKQILRSAQDDSEGSAQHDRDVFWAFAKAGKELARLHIEYEKLEPYPLKFLENRDLPLSYRVEDKMRLAKDRRSLKVNPSLTLSGIPPETFEYRLGNRSALEWVIDQYQVTEDKRSGIRADPNRADDPEYIVRLVGQVIQVSLETVKLVKSLPALAGGRVGE